MHLTQHAKKIVTDSGGLQCEAFYAGVQCLLVMDHVVWPETMVDNRNQLARPDKNDILKKLSAEQHIDPALPAVRRRPRGRKNLRYSEGSNIMKYALIGYGMICANHTRAALETGLEIVALAISWRKTAKRRLRCSRRRSAPA